MTASANPSLGATRILLPGNIVDAIQNAYLAYAVTCGGLKMDKSVLCLSQRLLVYWYQSAEPAGNLGLSGTRTKNFISWRTHSRHLFRLLYPAHRFSFVCLILIFFQINRQRDFFQNFSISSSSHLLILVLFQTRSLIYLLLSQLLISCKKKLFPYTKLIWLPSQLNFQIFCQNRKARISVSVPVSAQLRIRKWF